MSNCKIKPIRRERDGCVATEVLSEIQTKAVSQIYLEDIEFVIFALESMGHVVFEQEGREDARSTQ